MTRHRILLRWLGAGAATLLLTVCTAAGGMAGDFAERDIIGFSPDGGIFAFEQHGTQDGSGFPYAEIFVVETANDRWVAGTPFRVRIDDETATVLQARRQAAAQAAPLLAKLDVTIPGHLLAHNPPSELSADPHAVTVNTRQTVPPSEEAWRFTLEEVPLNASHCAGIAEPAAGFRLKAQRGDATPTVWHADKTVPESRGCPLRYGISDVVMADGSGGPKVFAVLISVFAFGFEGPDRRFVAVTRLTP